MKKYFNKQLSSLLVLVLISVSTISFSARAEDLNCQYVDLIMQKMLKQHVLYNDYTNNLENRTIEQYIKKLDGNKIYLIQEDVDNIKSKLKGIQAKIKANKCVEVLTEVNGIVKKRITERADFAKQLVGKDFQFSKTEEIVLDPKLREYPKSRKQAEEFQRKYVQFQVANFLASDMKLEEAKTTLKNRYDRVVKQVSEQKFNDTLSNFLDSFARALDPHSSYFSKDVLEDFEISMSLSLEGIGATLSSQDGYTVIEQLIPGGAAAESGNLKVQDKIIAVGQGDDGKMEPIIDEDLRDVVRKIRGKKGTRVRLSILRKGETNERFETILTRKKINLEEEAAQISYIEKKAGDKKLNLAVLDLPSFYSSGRDGERSAAKDVKVLLAEARAKNVDGLVLDLSNNGGGSLEDAVKIAGLFFAKGNVVETGGTQLADLDQKVDFPGPLVILTSRISASASEIVAGALRDYKRAIIVGNDHTYGKGSVQQVMPLPPGLGAIKVTIGMFFVPGGNSTQHRGVESDILIPGPFAQDDISEKSQDYSLPPKTIRPFISKEALVTSGEDKWEPINPAVLPRLRNDSAKRVMASKDFDKIKNDLKKIDEKSKVVKLSEVLKDKTEQEEKKKAKRTMSKDEKKKEYLAKPEVQESLNILSEMITGSTITPAQAIADKGMKTEKQN